MSNFDKLAQAGIIGTPHVISADDQEAINALTDHEIDALIAVKSKLAGSGAGAPDAIGPVGTISF